MTKSYYYGRVETPKPKKTKTRKLISDDVINQDEVEYNQLKNKIANLAKKMSGFFLKLTGYF